MTTENTDIEIIDTPEAEKAVLHPFDAFILSNDLSDRIILLRLLKNAQGLPDQLMNAYLQIKKETNHV